MSNILFFSEDIEFTPKSKIKIRSWIKETILDHSKKIGFINFIFTSDKYLSNINREYLNHETFTDIYISVERVKDNSKNLNVHFEDELHRVMIHGLLHLLGYNDKTESEKSDMRKKENHYLALRPK